MAELRITQALRLQACICNQMLHSSDVFSESDEEHARWMGHGVHVHTRIYRKWMPMERQKEAVRSRRQQRMNEEPQKRPTSVDLPDDVLAKLAQLEKLKKLMAS